MKLLLATHNAHKVRELRSLLKSFKHLDIYSLRDFPDYKSPKETGATFEENAKQKAVCAAKALGMWAMADDSGLVVPALNGAPGVFSSRYAGEGAADIDNRKKLLKEMESLEDLARAAYFECCIALASPQGIEKCVKGLCEGTITKEERGRSGFGYDSIFVKHEYNQTFAELSETVKNQISHRAKAFEKISIALDALFAQGV